MIGTDETVNIDTSQMQHVKQQCHTIELLQPIETLHTLAFLVMV